MYYGDTTIPSLHNSFFITTFNTSELVSGSIYVFHLNKDRKTLRPSTEKKPNPSRFFLDDNPLKWRLRDITINHDGTKLY